MPTTQVRRNGSNILLREGKQEKKKMKSFDLYINYLFTIGCIGCIYELNYNREYDGNSITTKNQPFSEGQNPLVKVKNPSMKRFIEGFLRTIYPLEYLMLVKDFLRNPLVITEGLKTFSEKIFLDETKSHLPRTDRFSRDSLTKISSKISQ